VIQRRSLHDAWGPPGKVDALSSVGDDNAITFSNDGRLIFFGSDRPGGCRGTDIWSARRTNPHDDFVWEAPVNLGCTINSSQDDDGPTYFEAASGEKAEIFCSFNRPSAVAAGFGDCDIDEVSRSPTTTSAAAPGGVLEIAERQAVWRSSKAGAGAADHCGVGTAAAPLHRRR
jgi:hypothetical protein